MILKRFNFEIHRHIFLIFSDLLSEVVCYKSQLNTILWFMAKYLQNYYQPQLCFVFSDY